MLPGGTRRVTRAATRPPHECSQQRKAASLAPRLPSPVLHSGCQQVQQALQGAEAAQHSGTGAHGCASFPIQHCSAQGWQDRLPAQTKQQGTSHTAVRLAGYRALQLLGRGLSQPAPAAGTCAIAVAPYGRHDGWVLREGAVHLLASITAATCCNRPTCRCCSAADSTSSKLTSSSLADIARGQLCQDDSSRHSAGSRLLKFPRTSRRLPRRARCWKGPGSVKLCAAPCPAPTDAAVGVRGAWSCPAAAAACVSETCPASCR